VIALGISCYVAYQLVQWWNTYQEAAKLAK